MILLNLAEGHIQFQLAQCSCFGPDVETLAKNLSSVLKGGYEFGFAFSGSDQE